MADEFEFAGYVTSEQAAQIEKQKELTALDQDPNIEIKDPFEVVADRWIGPAPQNIGAVDGYMDYLKLVELNKKRDRGLMEEAFDFEMAEVPIIGGFAEAGKLLRIADIAKRMNKGEVPTDKELLDFNAYIEYSKRKQNATLGAKVMDVWQQSLSFMTEIGAGLLTAGVGVGAAVGGVSAKAGAKKVLTEAIEKVVKESAENALAKTIRGSVATGARKTAADLVQKTATNYAYQKGSFKGINEVMQAKTLELVGKHMSPKAANLLSKAVGTGTELEARAVALQLLNPDNTVASYANRKVQAALANEDQSEATLIIKALLDTNIEYATEFSGEVIGKVAGKAIGRYSPQMKKAMTQSAVLSFMASKYDTVGPKAATEVLKVVGINNILEEMAEERAGGFLRGLLGVDSTPGLVSAVKGLWPGGEEFMTEAIAFSILPVGMYMADRATGGASGKERVQYREAVKNWTEQDDVVAVAESDMRKKAEDLVKIIDDSKKPWYSDIKWMENLFGKEKRGSLRGGLQSVADVLEEKGINILKVLDQKDASIEERVSATAATMALMQNVRWEKFTQAEAEMMNGGLKDSSVIKKNLGPYRATVLTEKFLDKPGAGELVSKVGNLSVETGDVRNLSYGSYNAEQFTGSWDKMTSAQKGQLMARWGTQDQSWAKQKYEGIKGLLATSWGKDFEIVDTLPALLVKTGKEWDAIGQPVGSRDLIWGQNEAGENVYARSVFAWNDGKTIGLAPSSDMSDISEDTIEAGLKQKYDDLLPEAAEIYLDQLQVNLVNERDERNPAKDVDFLPQQRREKKEAIDNILGMLSTRNGRREIFAKAVVMNRLGYAGVPGKDAERYRQANSIFGLLSFDDAFDSMLEDVLPRDVLNALNKSSKGFTGQEMSPRGMEIRDSLLQRQAGAVKVVRTALNKAIAEYEEKQAADQILVKLKEAQNVAKSDTRKKGVREDLAKRIEDLDKDITFSSEALGDLNKIGAEIEGIAQRMSESGRFEWAQYINEIDKDFDFEKIKEGVESLFTEDIASRIIAFLEEANEKHNERLEKIEMPPERIHPAIEEGTEKKGSGSKQKEKRVFGKTATPGDAYAEWSLKGEEGEFEPEYNLESAAYENDFIDLIDADLIPAWLRIGAPKAMALWATMEDLYDRSNLELIATIGLESADSYGVWDKPASVEDAISQLSSLKYLAGRFLDESGIGTLTTKDGKVMIGQPDYSGREERGRYRDVAETAEAGTGTGSESDMDFEQEDEKRTGLISIDEIDVSNGIGADEANRIFGEYDPRNVYEMEELDAERPLAEQIEVIFPIGGKAAREMTNPVTGLAKKVGEKLFQVDTESDEPMSVKDAFTIVSTPSQIKNYQFGDYFIRETKTGVQYPVKRNSKKPGYTWNRTLDVIKKPLTAGFNRSERFNVQGVIIVLDPNIEDKTSYVASRMIYAGQTGRYVDMPVMIEWKKNKQGKYFLDQNGNPAIDMNNRDLLAQLPLATNVRNNFDDGASNFATFVISADRLRSMQGNRSTKLAGEIRKWMLKNRIKRLGIMELDSIAQDYANFTAPDYHEQLQATVATALNMKTQEDAAILQREQEIAIEMLEKFERAKQIENQSVPVTTFEDMQKASQDGVYVMIGEFSGRHIGTEALWLWGNRGADTSVAGEMTPSGNVFVLPAYNIESPATERFSPNVFAAGIRALNEHAQDNPSVKYYVAINPETMAYLNEGLADIDPFFGKVAASDATEQQKFTRNDILSYFAREDLAPNVLFAQEDAKTLSISVAPAKSERYEVLSMQLKNALRSIAEKGLSSMPQIERGKIAPEVFQKWVWEAMDSQESQLAEEAVDEHGNYEAERGPDGRRSFADVRGLVGMRREAEAAEERGLPSLERIPAEGTSLVEKDISRMQNAAKRRKDARVHLSFNPKYFMSVHQNSVDISSKRKTNEHFGPPKETIVRAQEEVADFNAGEEVGLDPETASRQTAANYRSWLNGTGFKNIEQGRRKWILEQIPNLRGKILVGKDTGGYIENHAYILSNMVNTMYPTNRAKASAKVMESNLKPLVLSKIVSGGQTGADRAGLDLGKKLGLETGGYAPKGYETEQGSDKSLQGLGLVEVTPEQTEAYTGRNKKWGPRTELNVIESDGTVWFGSPSPGKQLTQRHALQNSKPFIDNPTAEQLNKWLRIHQVETLNVAGNRASGNRNVGDITSKTIAEAIKLKNTISTTYSAGIVQFELGISPVGRWIVQDATGLTTVAKLKTLEGYDEAKKKGNTEAAKKLASQLISASNASGLARQEDILVPVFKGSATNNMIPLAMAGRLSELTGASVDRSIVQTNKSSHLGASAMERLITRASFAGVVEPGKNYIIVDDVLTSGSTISGLREFIESHGGHVTGIVSAGGSFSPQTGSSLRIAPEKEILDKIRANMSETQLTEILNEYGIAQNLEHLTASQARYIASFKSIESFSNKLNNTIEELESRIIPTEAGPENGASELETVQVTYSLTPATMFDRITPKLYQSISDKNMWDIDDQNVLDIISWVSALKERFRNYPEMTIEEMALDNRIANPMRDEIVAELKDQLAQYRESEYFHEVTHSLGLAQDFMERADVWFHGGSTGLKVAFIEQHRLMKAAMHNTGLWGNRLREAVGIDNPKVPKEDQKLVKEAARNMLRALKHKIDNPHAEIVITGRAKNGFHDDGKQRWKGTSDLESIDILLSKYDVLAEKHGLLKSDLVMNEIRSRIQNERKLVNASVAEMTEKEWIDQLENYMHHSYQKREKDESEPVINAVAGEFAAAKGRVFPTFDDAIKFGFVPSSEDAISNTLTWSKVAWKKARDKFVLNAGMIMTESDGAPVMLPIFGAESGPTLFDDDAIRKLNDNLVSWANTEFKLNLKVDTKNEPKDELMRLMTKIPKLNKQNGYQQVNVDNLSGVTGIIVLEGPAENMLRWIDSSRWTNNVVSVLESMNSWMKFLALSFSLFHPFSLFESFIAGYGVHIRNPILHPFRSREAYKAALARLKTDPEYSAFWIRHGMELNVTSPDIDRGGTLNTQISNWIEHMNILSDKENVNVALQKVGTAVETGLKAMQKLKDIWDKKLWMEFQPAMKIMNAELEKQLQETRLGRQLEKNEVTDIAQYVNLTYGGIEFEQLAWTNPKVMQALHLGMFAPDWTFSSLGSAGFGGLFGVKYNDIQKDAMLFRSLPGMIALVMFGIPAAIQGSMAILLGDPDDGDEVFPWNNGPDRTNHIDVTPLVRRLPGYKGDPTGKRRVYIRFGKQGYEITEGWMQKPWETMKSKSSQVVKSVAEQVTGESMNGWELGFKDKGLIGIVKGEGGFWDSRLGTQLQHFVPMSLLSYTKGQPSTVFAPASRGLSPTATIKNMSAKLDAFADQKNDKLIKQYNLRLEDVVAEDIHWSKVNGYNAEYIFKRAVSAVRSKYYSQFFYALNDNDTKEMEELAGKILKLQGEEENLIRSVRAKLTNVGKKMGVEDISAIHSAFNSK